MSDLNVPVYNGKKQQQGQDTNLLTSLIDLCALLNYQLQMPFVALLAPVIPQPTPTIIDADEPRLETSKTIIDRYKIFCQYPNPSCLLKDPIGNWPTDKLKTGALKIMEDIRTADFPYEVNEDVREDDPKQLAEGFPIFNVPYRFLLMLPFSSHAVNLESMQNEDFAPSKRVKSPGEAPFVLCLMDIKPRQLHSHEIDSIRKITHIISSTCHAAAKHRGLQLQLKQLRHDLRTPLTCMTMIPQMLQTDPALSTENLQLLDQILVAACKMDELLDTTPTITPTTI